MANLIIVNSKEFKTEMKKKFNVDSIYIYNPLNKNEISQSESLFQDTGANVKAMTKLLGLLLPTMIMEIHPVILKLNPNIF